MGPNAQMQTIMARGLFSKFKQPIFVDFDVKVSYDLLMLRIIKLPHPVTGFEIFMFSDIPHLLKLLRNWFIDGGFLLEDDTELYQGKIRELLQMRSAQYLKLV